MSTFLYFLGFYTYVLNNTLGLGLHAGVPPLDLSQLQCTQQPEGITTIPQLLFKSPLVIPGFNSKPVKAQKRRSCLRKNPVTLCQLGRIRGFKICHLNMRSLVPKLDEFKIMLAQTKAHVMAISESWLTPVISDSFLAIKTIHYITETVLIKLVVVLLFM